MTNHIYHTYKNDIKMYICIISYIYISIAWRCIDLYRYRSIDIDIDIYLQATLIRMNVRESCWEGFCFLGNSWTLVSFTVSLCHW